MSAPEPTVVDLLAEARLALRDAEREFDAATEERLYTYATACAGIDAAQTLRRIEELLMPKPVMMVADQATDGK